MSRLPVCRAREALAALRWESFALDHQTGSHAILRRIIRDAGLTVEEFRGLL